MFIKDANLYDDTDENCNLNEHWTELKKNVNAALDKQIPLTKKFKRTSTKTPWYDLEIQNHKKRLQHAEKVWRKDQSQRNLATFQFIRSSYTSMIKFKKWKYLSSQIKLHKSDASKIFKIVTKATGAEKENPLPYDKSDENLANSFVDYFSGKIENIRSNLEGWASVCTTEKRYSANLR